MAANVDSLAFSGALPWHGEGLRLPQHATVDEMIRFGGIDWEIIPQDVFVSGSQVEGYKGLTRSDTGATLSIVGKDYGIVQNREALSLAEAIVGTGKACAEVGGALDGGRKVFVLLSSVKAFDVLGDEIKSYILVATAHDGTMSVIARFCSTRVVCSNTLQAAMGEDCPASINIRHTSQAASRVAQAASVLDAARAYFGTFNEKVMKLAAQRISLSSVAEVSNVLFPTKLVKGEKVVPFNQGRYIEMVRVQSGIPADRHIAGTKWGAYNALTALLDHNGRGKSGRLARTLTGSQDALRGQALDLLIAA